MNKLDIENNWLDQTLALSNMSVEEGNHPFGALLVIGDDKVLDAKNNVNTEQDVTCHAEMNLVRRACQTLTQAQRKQAVLYTSTEPCAMCAGAIYWSGIKQVVFACSGKKLNDIAGDSLICHSDDVYKGAIDPPNVCQSSSQHIIKKAEQQHKAYWTQDWTEMP